MRPRGDITKALANAWQQGPASVTQAAHRACVGLNAARYTASRMVCRGELVVLQLGRPAVLGLPGPAEPAGPQLHNYFNALSAADKAFWENSK